MKDIINFGYEKLVEIYDKDKFEIVFILQFFLKYIIVFLIFRVDLFF